MNKTEWAEVILGHLADLDASDTLFASHTPEEIAVIPAGLLIHLEDTLNTIKRRVASPRARAP